jgi:hypothetical protein
VIAPPARVPVSLLGLLSPALAIALALVPATGLVGCGADVDLGGGGSSSSAIDAGPPAGQCAPCASGSNCTSGTCGQFAGDLFCGTVCASSADCAASETCTAVTTTTGSTAKTCVPSNGVCTPAAPPATADGGAVDHCGTLNGPSVTSACTACGKFSNDCQPNGCYGGYWCNEAARDCTPPPKTCP